MFFMHTMLLECYSASTYFFEQEQEYSIVLPNEKIKVGKSCPVQLSADYEKYDLNTFLKIKDKLLDVNK